MPAAAQVAFEYMTPKSNLRPLLEPLPVPIRFTSQKTPAPRKPLGEVTEPEIIEILIALKYKV